MADEGSGRGYGFGPYRLDFEAGRLCRDGEPVPITPKALEILHLLVSRSGRIVTKQEVRDLVWPGITVGEKNLTVQMVAVRKALRDVSKRPLFVETIPRKGYRFIATVWMEQRGLAPGGAGPDGDGVPTRGDGARPASATDPQRRAGRPWRLWAAALSLPLLAFLLWRRAGTVEPPRPQERSATDLSVSRDPLAGRSATNVEAHQLYLKGRYFWGKRTADGLEKAVSYFNQAVERDPTYALGYAGLADAYAVLADGREPANEYLRRAADAAQRALALDGSLAEPYLPLAFAKACNQWDWAGAGEAFQKSIELRPDYATAHQWYGIYLADLGRFDEAIREGRRAHQLDPLSPTVSTSLAGIYYRARRYPQAIASARDALEIEPSFAGAHGVLAEVSWQQGLYGRWLDESLQALRLEGASETWIEALRAAYAREGPKGCVRTRLAFLETVAKREYIPPMELAQLHARLGETDQALGWIERALDSRDGGLENLGVDPVYDSLRGEARFRQCLRRTGLVS